METPGAVELHHIFHIFFPPRPQLSRRDGHWSRSAAAQPAGTLGTVPVYLDHAASSPMPPEVAAVMQDWLARGFGNPSGSHAVARRAKATIEEARESVASFLGVPPAGVVFTSGGTEADNLAVLGALPARPGPEPGAVVVSAVEHPAVLEAARVASAHGHELRVVGVGADGLLDLEALRRAVDRHVSVVSVQTANNETGVVQPVEQIGRRVRKWAPEAAFHTDAVQAAPWMDLGVVTAEADLITMSGHKIGGPQGIGALGIRRGVEVSPLLYGGGQEHERRSGTQNVLGIIGLAAAVELTSRNRAAYVSSVRDLRELLAGLLERDVPGAVRTVTDAPVLPGHCHFRFPGVESEALIFLLDEKGIYASAGAACASGAIEPSPVLLAMGVDKSEAGSALRLTLGPATTESDVRAAAAVVADAVGRLRAF